MSATGLASKLRRARRNGTGLRIDHSDIETLARLGIYEILARAEGEELCLVTTARASTATSGSTNAATANRPTSGKSPITPPPLDASSIAALSEGM